MKAMLFAAGAVTMLVAGAPASAQVVSGMQQSQTIILVKDQNERGGYDYGTMGQCFDARVCGHGRGAYASGIGCSTHRERLVTQSGRVIIKRHRVCG